MSSSKQLVVPDFNDFRWVLQAHAMLGAFYNALGNQKKCEAAYVMYIKLLEQFYGEVSLEASNSYFLMGAYYHEQGDLMLHKAIACFGKSYSLRKKMFQTD
jgi:hypothetical protein